MFICELLFSFLAFTAPRVFFLRTSFLAVTGFTTTGSFVVRFCSYRYTTAFVGDLRPSTFLFEGVNLGDLLGVIFEVASQTTGGGFCAGDGRGGVLMFLSGFGQTVGSLVTDFGLTLVTDLGVALGLLLVTDFGVALGLLVTDFGVALGLLVTDFGVTLLGDRRSISILTLQPPLELGKLELPTSVLLQALILAFI